MKRSFEEVSLQDQSIDGPSLPMDILVRLLWYTSALASTCTSLARCFRDPEIIAHRRRSVYVLMTQQGDESNSYPLDWDWYINHADFNRWNLSYKNTGDTGIYNYSSKRHKLLLREDVRFPIKSTVKLWPEESNTIAGQIRGTMEDPGFRVKLSIEDPESEEPIIGIAISLHGGEIFDTAITLHKNKSVSFSYGDKYARFLAKHPQELVNFATCGIAFPNQAITSHEFPLMDCPESVAFFHGLL